ncbi:hypothetical protein HN865_00230 [Candidatus Woesearchaeota archaeon]|jgi:hypothetical protein|nr:hypothetical protein [Candidatus Woesearchaeota archaeon]MBT7237268.1 hypothetical protein [Candidatus Woesearchaeota archaeon]
MYKDKKIADDTGTHYKLEGDNFWYERVYGPGEDIPLINIGPGPHPDPRVIGPKKDESLTGLLKKLKE